MVHAHVGSAVRVSRMPPCPPVTMLQCGISGDPDAGPKIDRNRPEPPMSGLFGIPSRSSVDPRETESSGARRGGHKRDV